MKNKFEQFNTSSSREFPEPEKKSSKPEEKTMIEKIRENIKPRTRGDYLILAALVVSLLGVWNNFNTERVSQRDGKSKKPDIMLSGKNITNKASQIKPGQEGRSVIFQNEKSRPVKSIPRKNEYREGFQLPKAEVLEDVENLYAFNLSGRHVHRSMLWAVEMDLGGWDEAELAGIERIKKAIAQRMEELKNAVLEEETDDEGYRQKVLENIYDWELEIRKASDFEDIKDICVILSKAEGIK